jgi:hypothetical protein
MLWVECCELIMDSARNEQCKVHTQSVKNAVLQFVLYGPVMGIFFSYGTWLAQDQSLF